MIRGVLQKLKGSLWSTGTQSTAVDQLDPGTARYSDSEIALLKLQRKRSNASAKVAVLKRGAKLHPRIEAARAKGAKV